MDYYIYPLNVLTLVGPAYHVAMLWCVSLSSHVIKKRMVGIMSWHIPTSSNSKTYPLYVTVKCNRKFVLLLNLLNKLSLLINNYLLISHKQHDTLFEDITLPTSHSFTFWYLTFPHFLIPQLNSKKTHKQTVTDTTVNFWSYWVGPNGLLKLCNSWLWNF